MDHFATVRSTDGPTPFSLSRAMAAAARDVDGADRLWRNVVWAAVDVGFEGAAVVAPDDDVLAAADFAPSADDLRSLAPTTDVRRVTVDGSPFVAIPITSAEERFGALFLGVPDDWDERFDRLEVVGTDLGHHAVALESADLREDEVTAQRRTFRKLHSVAAQMVGATEEAGIYHLAIDAAENILQFDSCSLDIVEDGYFVPVATSSGMPDEKSERLPADEGLAGETYRTNRSIVVDDVQAHDSARPTDETYRSVLSIPIDDIGVFQAATTERGAFGERDVDLAELLMAYVSQTITRIRSEAALRENETKYRTLVEQSHDAVLIVRDDSIVFANERAEALFGFDEAALRELDVWDLAYHADRHRVVQAGRDLLVGTDESVTFDARITRSDGETRFCEFSANAIEYRGGRALMATVRDISERKEYEQELERQNERLDEFASVISHDLRNPLNVAQGRISLAAETGDTSHLESAQEALDRMGELIEGVLQLARQGQHVDETTTVSLAEVVADAWRTVDTRDATLVSSVEDTAVDADEGRLRQLFENVFRNVVDHVGPDATVTVEAMSDGFAISDDGPGIDEANLETIFERGYSSHEDGTGFGLAIVENIADAHGWTVEAVPCDEGARFEVHDVVLS